MKEQYNFKIEDSLKNELENLHNETGLGKEDFLKKMLNSYKNETLTKINTEIDLSKYDNIDTSTKLAINDTFKHLLAIIEANTTNCKLNASHVELEKKSLDEKIQIVKDECENDKKNLSNDFQEQLQIKNDKIADLEKKLIEFENIKLLADQSKIILKQNLKLEKMLEKVQD